MNDKRRARIKKIIEKLKNEYNVLDGLIDEEQSSFDNLPENFQDTDRGESIEESIATLENAADNLQEAIDGLEEVV